MVKALRSTADQPHAQLEVLRKFFLLYAVGEQREAACDVGQGRAKFVRNQLDQRPAGIIQFNFGLFTHFLAALQAVADGDQKIFGIERFDQVVVNAQLFAKTNVVLGASRGEENEGNGTPCGHSMDCVKKGIAIQARHGDVAHDEVRLELAGIEQFKGILSVNGRENIIAFQAKHEHGIFAQVFVILYDQNSLFALQ